jgi:uncharacterized protein YgbK (DUF1537 family)
VRAVVIADDLTGAADAGVQLVRAGYRTGVAFWEAPLPPADGLDAVVADTDSRALAPVDAAARVASVAGALKDAPLLFKKVDSTLRGPIGAEVRAALEASGRARLVVAPAFPAAGRTTRGGVQHVRGQPLADVAQLLGLPDVVADAEDDADLVALVRGIRDPSEVLWVGSAGLAAALGAVHPGPRDEPRSRPRSDGGVLVVIGTATPTAREQVSRLAAAAEDVPLDPRAVQTAVTRAAEALRASRCAVLHTTSAGPLGDELSRRIPGTLAAVVASVAREGNVHALVLSGGETAIHVARALGARGLLIADELEPGVPISRLIGPNPYPVVTKAGGFGGPMTLVHAVEALRG